MKLNLFSNQPAPEEDPAEPAGAGPMTGRTFPADEVVWGIVVRNGFDELDDPLYHRGRTQHAYLEGNDNVSICGFQPPQSGPRTRRRARLGLPSPGDHPMCGICARMVVAPRPKVAVPVRAARPLVALPVDPGTPTPMPPRSPAPAPVPASAAATSPMAPAATTPRPPARPPLDESELPMPPEAKTAGEALDRTEQAGPPGPQDEEGPDPKGP